jgi:hypothetical protein
MNNTTAKMICITLTTVLQIINPWGEIFENFNFEISGNSGILTERLSALCQKHSTQANNNLLE